MRSSDALRNLDQYLEAPYQEMYAREDEAARCPECGGAIETDQRERTSECEDCDWSDNFDWDAEAEARAEAKADAMEDERW